jgi:hypothetical protein
LEYPQSIRVYDDYLHAHHVVDNPSDQQFPVQNLARDFPCASQIVAMKDEVLIEHGFIEQPREVLATRPAASS